MNPNTDYKYKALKYKAKYLELKRQFTNLNINGGNIPVWYNQFENELKELFTSVSNNYPEVFLTGSGMIAYLLKKLEMYDELENFIPNDLDFYYKSKMSKPNVRTINDYKIKPNQITESSVTFLLDSDKPNFIKSFDISKTSPNAKSFNLDNVELNNLNNLKSDYKIDFGTPEERIEKDKYKIKLIDKIIQKIGLEGRLEEFGLGDNITKREPKRKMLFDSDNTDDSIDMNLDTSDFMASNFGYSPIKLKLYDDTDDFMANNFGYETPVKTPTK